MGDIIGGIWRSRRKDECTKIREMEKEERLAIAREKKKGYGIKQFGMKERQEERLEVAQAKANYWKFYREGGKMVK